MKSFIALFVVFAYFGFSQAIVADHQKGLMSKCSWNDILDESILAVNITGQFCDQVYDNRQTYVTDMLNCVSTQANNWMGMTTCMINSSTKFMQAIRPIAEEYMDEIAPVAAKLLQDIMQCKQ